MAFPTRRSPRASVASTIAAPVSAVADHTDGRPAADEVAGFLVAAFELLALWLRLPLDTACWIRDERRKRYGDLRFAAVMTLADFGGVGANARRCRRGLRRLGGQAEHEINITVRQPRLKHVLDRVAECFFVYRLVDHVAQALGARFGGEGETAFADAGDVVDEADIEAVDA